MGDTDFVRVPVAGLLDKAYAARLRSTSRMESASKSTDVCAGQPAGAEASDTTHFTIVDEAGNLVANTYPLNGD